ncbi:uncharacterized protein A1O5_11427 [Cladophialophora psammophila CBS 110553]|uniref:Uncharacterized protein n=1 Tax=Cladophialophora psammophila CBS 110553 TaxID=1182543 RepID=W9W608_9EURO|nr:uncharacterized protein A1O5_11427 [Cladophialophora psammophila CBS 110553]EXJ63378.1 hypothetical protein A1O5_11427 [Cladophialophora psammophila CBS 110553]
MSKVQLHDHTASYHAITTKSPQGLQCLKRLFLEYDNANPSRANLNRLFSRDFTDNENESERNIGRDEAIQTIISTRAKCSRHQIDLKRATCLVNSGSSHTVFFEGVRFMMFAAPQESGSDAEPSVVEDKSDWTRVPFAGRIEVRVKENKFSLKEAVAEIYLNKEGLDVEDELHAARQSGRVPPRQVAFYEYQPNWSSDEHVRVARSDFCADG